MDKKLDKKLDLSRLAKRLVSEDGMADSGAACSAIQEYKRFLCLVSEWDTVGHACYIPAPAVDKVWQRHVLDTQQYFDDCEAFDVPGYYLHRHELWSIKSWPQHSKVIPAGSEIGSLSADAAVVQGHYNATKAAYLRAFGEAPRQDVWPDQYEYTAPVGGHRQLNNSSGDMYVAYALPQALLPRDTHTLYSAVSIEEYAMPTEQELMDDLKWVGDLVFDSLPTKKNVCAEGEALTRISFDSDVGRDTAVGRVVREYARFLLLIMKKKKIFHLKNRKIWNGDLEDEEEFSHYEFESDAELTPSKLVDECWHAHILRSPAYFEFCTKHAPFGEYIHHFPHFDKPHGYHVPGFKATLELYKQEFGGEIPVKSVWGVLGESGGGCGGGGCGGGGDGGDGGGGCGGGDGGGACSAALCMFSNHNRTRNSHAAKVRPLIDNSLVGFGGNCGAGIFTSSCGAGLGNAVDPSDLRRPQDRPKVNIIPNYRKVRPGTDTAIQKILCEINVFETCLNKHNLSSSVPAPTSCIKLAAYSTTYMKEGFLCSGPTPVPIKFMSPAYVSSALFSQFQAAMSDAITNRYQAAVLISRLSGSNLKDGYWRTWKISVFGAITSVLDAINQALSQINLMAVIVFVENRGGEVYITPKLAGIWSAPPGGALAFHTPMIAGAPKRGRELAWSDESLMSPENITRLNREILPTSQDGIVEGSWELLHSGKVCCT